MLFKIKISDNLILIIVIIVWLFLLWLRDIVRETKILGHHTLIVKRGFQFGMILFIFREIILFFRFFWTFFHRSLSPNQEIGLIWPPYNINGIDPFEIPILNTLLLLSRGLTVTWSHYKLLKNGKAKLSLLITLTLGLYFSYLQLIEYKGRIFNFRDSVFGNIFFMATGFHGIHVLIGSRILFYSLIRLRIWDFSQLNPIGFEVSIWYWHFVDVVWLFLFSFIYWWGY